MISPKRALAERIRELRRRHFGARGKARFAEALGLTNDEYQRFERGTIPPGEVLVRICEVTGEDLQWLLTGVAARGTVVIAGARGRHQQLLGQIARVLEDRPALAGPLEAFLDLLTHEPVDAGTPRRLPKGDVNFTDLVPVLAQAALPVDLPNPGGGSGWPLVARPDAEVVSEARLMLCEPAMTYAEQGYRSVKLVTTRDPDGQMCEGLRSKELPQTFPGLFGVRVPDKAMAPMFERNDIALAYTGGVARVGCPALVYVRASSSARCRIWLGHEDDTIHLGRVNDGEVERFQPDDVLWSLEILFRLAPAA